MSIIDLFHSAKGFKTLVLIAMLLFLLSAGKSLRSQPAVEILQAVRIGGMDQWILACGDQPDLSVLLWLHGGPGAAEMPVARSFNQPLEKEFIVVHWDQRGAGKSNPKDFDESTMNFGRYVADALELTQYLRKRFGQDKIYLLGHSWGTRIGLVLAERHPELYHAYIGVSQLSDGDSSQILAHEWLTNKLTNEDRKKDLQKLEDLGEPPYRDHEHYVRFAQMLDKYGANMDVGMPRLIWEALHSPYYSFRDYLAWFRGANRGSGPMWQETQSKPVIDLVRRVDLPVWFISGEKDYNTPLSMVEKLMHTVQFNPPAELVIFKDCAHTPHMGDPPGFQQVLFQIKEDIQGSD